MQKLKLVIEPQILGLDDPARVLVFIDGKLASTVTAKVAMIPDWGKKCIRPLVTLIAECLTEEEQKNTGAPCDTQTGACACGHCHE